MLLLKAGGFFSTELFTTCATHACTGDVWHDFVEPVLHPIPLGSPRPAAWHRPAAAGEVFAERKGRSLMNGFVSWILVASSALSGAPALLLPGPQERQAQHF